MTEKVERKLKSFLNKKRIQKRLFTSDLLIYLETLYPKKSLNEQWFLYSHNLKQPPRCKYKNCKNKALFNESKKKYSEGCCLNHCRKISMLEKYGIENPMQIQSVKQKRKDDCLRKHGVENISQLEEIKEKKKKVCLIRFGQTTNLKCDDTKEKIKQTNLKKYGVENVSQSDEIKEKKKKKAIEKYDVENVFQAEEIKEKIKHTNLEKYGVERPSKCEEIKKRIRKTFLDKYGVENPMHLGKVKQKISDNCLKKYGVTHHNEYHVKNYKKYNNKKFVKETFVNGYVFDYISFCEYFNVSSSTAFKKIKQFDIKYKKRQNSLLENKLKEFVSNYVSIISNDRNVLEGKELDIYIPERNVAIEINGDYWHSELNGKNSEYHLVKTEICEEKNIRLIHVFENEINNKNHIVKSMILSLIGIYEKVIDAKDCEIIQISSDKAKRFFDSYHIEGFAYSDINLCLVKNEEYVSVMSFKSVSNGFWELVKYCDKLNDKIENSFETMLDYFVKFYFPTKIHHYLNRRFFNGFLLKKAGFNVIKKEEPEKLFLTKTRIIREKEQEFLNIGEPYHISWDCGNFLYEWKKHSKKM